MAQLLGQLKKSQKLTNLTRMMKQLLGNDSAINLEFIYAKKVMEIDQMLFLGI